MSYFSTCQGWKPNEFLKWEVNSGSNGFHYHGFGHVVSCYHCFYEVSRGSPNSQLITAPAEASLSKLLTT